MNWNKGYTYKIYCSVVDKKTWRDVDRFEIISADISKSESSLIEAADIETTRELETETWIRVWLDTVQGGESEHTAVFTGISMSPEVTKNGTLNIYKMQCYSVLKPAEDVLLPRGWYALAGANGGNIIKELFEVLNAPVNVAENAPAITDYIVAEDGESCLSMANKILNAINWRIRIDGSGNVYVMPKASSFVIRLDTEDNDSIEPNITVEEDWFDCPNIFRVVVDEMYAVAIDDSVDSNLSTINRGREVWAEETNCKLNDGESLAEYASRKLEEAQQYNKIISYNRRYNPDATVGDKVFINCPAQFIEGEFEIASQKVKLGDKINVSEEVIS